MRLNRVMQFLAFGLVALALSFGGANAKQIEIIIHKIGQKMTVKVDGRVEYVWPISSGAPRYATPSGKFRPFRMEEEHYSKEWDDAPMPHSIFFTDRGHAIHGTLYEKSLGRAVSHGCVRLSQANARTLFNLVEANGMNNTRVIVKGGFFDFGFSPRRSFASVGDDIDKTINRKNRKPWWLRTATPKKTAVKAKKPIKKDAVAKAKSEDAKKTVASKTKPDDDKKKLKKVAEKCTVDKAGKKTCVKPKIIGGEQG